MACADNTRHNEAHAKHEHYCWCYDDVGVREAGNGCVVGDDVYGYEGLIAVRIGVRESSHVCMFVC